MLEHASLSTRAPSYISSGEERTHLTWAGPDVVTCWYSSRRRTSSIHLCIAGMQLSCHVRVLASYFCIKRTFGTIRHAWSILAHAARPTLRWAGSGGASLAQTWWERGESVGDGERCYGSLVGASPLDPVHQGTETSPHVFHWAHGRSEWSSVYNLVTSFVNLTFILLIYLFIFCPFCKYTLSFL